VSKEQDNKQGAEHIASATKGYALNADQSASFNGFRTESQEAALEIADATSKVGGIVRRIVLAAAKTLAAYSTHVASKTLPAKDANKLFKSLYAELRSATQMLVQSVAKSDTATAEQMTQSLRAWATASRVISEVYKVGFNVNQVVSQAARKQCADIFTAWAAGKYEITVDAAVKLARGDAPEVEAISRLESAFAKALKRYDKDEAKQAKRRFVWQVWNMAANEARKLGLPLGDTIPEEQEATAPEQEQEATAPEQEQEATA
jgi:hypothetical protein